MSGFGNAPVWPSKEKEGWEFGFAKSYEWRDSARNLWIANSCSMSSTSKHRERSSLTLPHWPLSPDRLAVLHTPRDKFVLWMEAATDDLLH